MTILAGVGSAQDSEQQWEQAGHQQCLRSVAPSFVILRVLQFTVFPLIAAKALAPEVLPHSLQLLSPRLPCHHGRALRVQMQIGVRVGVPAQTATVGVAHKAAAVLRCCRHVVEVATQWAPQVLVQTGTAGLQREKVQTLIRRFNNTFISI